MTGELPNKERIKAANIAYERISRRADAPELSSQTGTLSHWHSEEYMLETYPEQLQSSGNVPTARHLDNIVLWTQPVAVSHTREASEETIQKQSAVAFNTSDSVSQVTHLKEIYGVGTAVATAILLFYDPERYTPMNKRSVAGLSRWGLWPDDSTPSAERYGEFLSTCRSVTGKTEFSLREIDRALYVFGGSDDDRMLISEVTSDLSSSSAENTQTEKSVPSISELRQRAVEAGQETHQGIETTTQQVTAYNRSTAVRDYAMARAEGHCESCGDKAPFIGTAGEPYLQVHHVDELSGGGEDTLENVIALCPNCHYRVHHGRDGKQFNRMLAERLSKIE